MCVLFSFCFISRGFLVHVSMGVKGEVMRIYKSFLVLVLLSFSLCGVVYGGAFQLYSESSAEGLSLAGSVIAREGMISNAWYNPATTTSIERPSLMAGMSALLLYMDYSSDLGSDSLQTRLRPTGYFYAILPFENDLNLNLSVNAPYGMITEWDNDWLGQYMSTYTNLRCIYFTPSLAWKANEQISLAAGVNFVYATARLARNLYAPHPALPQNNKVYMSADAIGVGYNLSAMYKPHEEWNLGVHYQSRVKLDFEGKAKYRHQGSFLGGAVGFYRDDGETEITLPSSLGFGVANTSFEKLTLSFDAVWTEWSTYADNNIKFDSYPGRPTPGQKGTAPKKKDWDDVWSFRLGASYQLNENWVLRAGYMYDNSPDNDRYRSPEMPDSDRNMFAFGFGYSKDNWGFDFGYSYLIFKNSRAGRQAGDPASDPNCASYRRSGKFESDLHVVSAAVKYMF
jgi:long-chain fatty acid transport protein